MTLASEGLPMGGLRAEIASRRDAIIALAQRLVAIPSDYPSHDERAIVTAIADEAAMLGLPPGEIHAVSPERPNLLVRLRGPDSGPSILLNAHVDTKPPGDRALWPSDPWDPRVADGSLNGLGSADMKGAVAAMLHAADVLRLAGLPRHGELLLAFTADEEAKGVVGLAHLMRAAALHPDVAMIGEPSGLLHGFDTLPLGSRGFVGFTIVARGERIHSALADRLQARTAVSSLARVIDRLPAIVSFGGPWPSPFADGPTLSIATSLVAGVAPGIVPEVAIASGDVRTVLGQSSESVAAALRQAIATLREEAGGDLDVEVEADPEDWPANSIAPTLALVRALSSATAVVLGRAPALGVFPGASEAHVLGRLGIPCVPAFGPGLLRKAHVPGESVPLEDLVDAAEIYTLALSELLG